MAEAGPALIPVLETAECDPKPATVATTESAAGAAEHEIDASWLAAVIFTPQKRSLIMQRRIQYI